MKYELFPWLILFLPLPSVAVITLFTLRSKTVSSLISIGAVVAGFVMTLLFINANGFQFSGETSTNWLSIGGLQIDFGLKLDALSMMMLLVVTGVGGAIHIYSFGYMHEDRSMARFFAFMSLFTFSMLGIVLANNFLMLFIFWELVGVSSYLLIGFWFEKPSAGDAAKKAFIVNRLGDFGFLAGILMVWGLLGSLNFSTLQNHLAENPAALGAMASIAGLLIFCGAMGKSAQFPLHVWLLDAREGPTPVSALIHAATMVAAGVYMVARMNPLFSRAPAAMLAVAIVGAVTAFYSATIGLVQTDIKKVLAYSTVSQLGYMFLACGVGAYAAGIFHLMTHAFFKGLLFLCAGSVIHAMGGEQNMNKMGGLRRKLPITFWTMFIATLAIAAVPPFSGYFSKDLILEAAYDSGHSWLWFLGVITAGLTSFYMFRLIFMTFFGESRVDSEKEHHLHESPAAMTIPLIVLALLATVGGWVNLPDGLLWGNAFVRFLAPAVGAFKPIVEASPTSLSLVASIASALGIALAYLFYLRLPGIPMLLAWRLQDLYNLLLNKYYIDQLYNFIVTRPLFWVSNNVLNRAIDSFAIDGAADGAGLAVQTSGQIARRAETGNVQHYAFVYLLGALGVVAYYLFLVTH